VLLILSACGATQPATAPTNAPVPTTAPVATAAAAPTTAAAEPAAPAAGATDQGACTPDTASTEQPSGKIRLVIGTGGTGGVFFPYGGGLARILTAKLPNSEATAEVTGGSVDNMKLIHANEADIGMSTVDSAYDAAKGQGSYADTGPIAACTIAVLYQSFLHVVALDGSGINTVADMKGKRISVGSAGSSTEDAADRVLEAAGLDPQNDITRDSLSVAESVAAMKDQKIDAFFWIGGLPTAAVTDLVATPNLKIKFVPIDQYLEPMRQKYGPVYTAFALPKDIYAGVEQDVPGIGIGNILFVNANMSEQLTYDILKTIFDNMGEVQTIHPEAKKLSLETAATGSSIPFHPGAIKFYTEKGVWKP
jgi:TRAP transporter TAXI family solute receptor